MARKITIPILLIILTGIFGGTAWGEAKIVLDEVTGIFQGKAVVNMPVRFIFRVEYTPGDGSVVDGFSTGFRVWTQRNGVLTDNFTPITYDTTTIDPPWEDVFDLLLDFYPYGVDGTGEDTVGIAGAAMLGSGFTDGFSEQVWWIETTPLEVYDTLFVDSSFFPPANTWMWVVDGATEVIEPEWPGPYFFQVVPPDWVYVCGDINNDNLININDITYLLNYLYFGGPDPICPWDK